MAIEKAGFALEGREEYAVDKARYWAQVWRRKAARKKKEVAESRCAGLP